MNIRFFNDQAEYVLLPNNTELELSDGDAIVNICKNLWLHVKSMTMITVDDVKLFEEVTYVQ